MEINGTNGSCTLFHGNEHRCEVIIGLKRAFGTLSLVGCVFMIGTIWLFEKYKVKSQQLILCLTIAALLDTIGYMIGDMTPDGPLCDFEAWWMSYFDWTVLAWVSCITFNLYILLTARRHINHLYYHLVSWVCPPLVFSVLPFFGDNYGPAGAWCWIKHDSIGWRFGIWYVPLFIIIFAMLILWARTKYIFKHAIPTWQGGFDQNYELTKNLIEEDMKTLQWYPLVFLALSFFPLILRIHNAATPEGDDVYALWILTAISAPLQGACNAIVFGLDPETKSKLTWVQIKMAFNRRFAKESVIQEYRVTEGESVIETQTSVQGENGPYGSTEDNSIGYT